MTSIEQGREGRRSWLPPASVWGPLLGGAVAVGVIIALVSWLPSSPEAAATVVKVCRDGSLVLRREGGEFRVVRPGASLGWHAASDKVCEP